MTLTPTAEAIPLPGPLRFSPFLASAVAVGMGLMVLAGWSFDLESIKRVSPGFVAMNPLTAIAFILSGGALALFLVSPAGRMARLATRMLALLVGWIGVVKLATLFGASAGLNIDTWFFTTKLIDAQSALPNRMAPNTAVNFFLVGLSLLGLHLSRPRLWLTQSCAILLGFGALLPLAGYAYGVHSFTGFASFIPMAVHTAFTFLILAAGIFFTVPEAPLPQVFASHEPRGVIARRLLPWFVLLTLSLGWLLLWGERRGYYESEFGTLLFAITLCLIFVVLVRWTVGTVSQLEHERTETQLRLAEMNRRKDEMVAVISHDLCSPLTGFQMVVNLLRSAEGKPDAQLLNLMDHSARRMASMVRGLLEATKPKAPQEVQLEFSELRLSKVVQDSMEPLLMNANAKEIDFRCEVAPDEPLIHVDHLRVSQIFNQLLSNAVKFTPQGGRIEVRIEPAFAGVRAEVHDSGIGISETDLPHIFEKYYQGSSAATAGEPGSGLGLALAREMATLHDGYIKVESEEGEGTTFTVYLPSGLHAVAA